MTDSRQTRPGLTAVVSDSRTEDSLRAHPRNKGTREQGSEGREDGGHPSMDSTGPRATSRPVDNALADVAPVMDGIDEDQPLFGGYEPPASELEQLSAGQRLTRRQAEQVGAGIHPLTGGRLHHAADRTRTADSPQDGTPTCGTCTHREVLGYHGKSYPKCTRDQRQITHGPATDVRAWWPACASFEPKAGA